MNPVWICPTGPVVMALVIRRYRPSDKDTVLTLFGTCTREHISPCFFNAMKSFYHFSVIMALLIAGYHLGSVFAAVLLPAAWTGLVYFSCYTLYDGYVRLKLNSDMADIVGSFLSRPDDCFWVAEVEGKGQVVGMVAVVAKQSGKERYGELFRMIIAPEFRRAGLGSRLTETVLAFSKERGFSKVLLETSSTQQPAVALYKKLGFRLFDNDFFYFSNQTKYYLMQHCVCLCPHSCTLNHMKQ
uniref:Si:ch211-81n22.1 n=1 Tax=Salarias fasciatus TaxID=181472 RepID=A0A672JMA3_SALFA